MSKWCKWICVLALVGIGATGCAVLTDSANRRADADVSPRDMQLRLDVLNRLQQDAVTSRYSFGVVSEDGEVTVYGSVPDETVRHRALGIARHTPGVVRVNDRITR